ncbi:RdRP-domain-containing protein [Obba rivulosa]|uniref:RNA-dependent RNA polymerase n=1 Tax=Obba rivulosa TaxID=1052685 RepID=A0A8E2DLH9_9APHY|nr:RdRP-domain-containing protein [Obba rivulosa]
MEIELKEVHFEANEWDVKRAIGRILHGGDFYNASDPRERPTNFKVILNPGRGGVQNNGSGKLILPTRKVGDKLLRWLRHPDHALLLNDKKMRLFRSEQKPAHWLKTTLEKTPYLPPEIEETKETILRKLDVAFHVDKVQFGVFFRTPGATSRSFSSEFEVSYSDRSAGILTFEYERKLIRIMLGETMRDSVAHSVALTFANIRKMAVGFDFGHPAVCFELLTPPMLEREHINREVTGDPKKDNKRFRQRIEAINEVHALIAPYAHQLRIILHEEVDMENFVKLCSVAGLQRPIRVAVEASCRGFFTAKRLNAIQRWIRTFDWPVAFQIETLLHNGLLNTEDLLEHLQKPIAELARAHPSTAGDVLRHFTEAIRIKDPSETPFTCFNRVVLGQVDLEPLQNFYGNFACYHVTFTPTRMVLEGPYVIQSNRVIRRYVGYEDHFIRVDFRDEDRLQYRWAKEVDGTSLLKDRVGGILRNGFDLAGRHFEFLAYSTSALREHAVWFMNPFKHPKEGWVTAQGIRDSLGDFSGVIKQPSKYAARMAQAFTATDPSVSITRDQWELMPELGEAPYLYTDGVGTISPELGDKIWEALCAAAPEGQRRGVRPSAYQIRFLGFKGMVAVDEQLKGIRMRLRPSMNKFTSRDEAEAKIEIARSFDYPGTCYLNRPLVTVLEDRGVEKEAFLKLQERTKAEIYTATDTILQAINVLKANSLGNSFKLSFIFQGLKTIGMGMPHERHVQVLEDPFFDRLLQYAQNYILRGIKHDARIPIPDSYLLVGVADEGPAYEAEGYKNVYTLPEGHIFACVQHPDDPEPTYLRGSVAITRSPTIHPGDVQQVTAIGKPPDDQLCFFRNLKNVVVLPSAGSYGHTGPRSLASCLGGGDLDGDLYQVIKYSPLLPTEHATAGSYESAGTRTLDRDSTVDDIIDFIVEYIDSDVLGLLSDRHLTIADQSKEGTSDRDCIELARLCSQAVDYPKNGVPVDKAAAPRTLISYRPDWKQAEDDDPRPTDYYESNRALGELFRNISITEPKRPGRNQNPAHSPPLADSISKALKPYIEAQLHTFHHKDDQFEKTKALFYRYVDELRYICITHALSDAPEVRLVEEEVVIGVIMAKCSQHRWRSDRQYRMRLHSSTLVGDISRKLRFARPARSEEEPSRAQLLEGLSRAWLAWDFSTRNAEFFGAKSFGLIALGVILNTLKDLGGFDLV